MLFAIPHRWLYPENLEEARAVQLELVRRIVAEDEFDKPVTCIGGVDVSNSLRDPEKKIFGAVVSLSFPQLAVVAHSGHECEARFPYIPGFLSFREIPVLIHAFERIEPMPELIMVDGHGISHPRGIGIASHLGVLLDYPTIGVAKSILVGQVEGELGPERGDMVPLVWKGNQIGVALRTKRKVKPVFVSVGHKISLDSAVEWVLNCNLGYRLPEPTRQAHMQANAIRRQLTLLRQTS